MQGGVLAQNCTVCVCGVCVCVVNDKIHFVCMVTTPILLSHNEWLSCTQFCCVCITEYSRTNMCASK